jgi:hypothetical protein
VRDQQPVEGIAMVIGQSLRAQDEAVFEFENGQAGDCDLVQQGLNR